MLVYFYFAGDRYLFSSVGDTPFLYTGDDIVGTGLYLVRTSQVFLKRNAFNYIFVFSSKACCFGVVPFGILFRCWSLNRGGSVLWRENRR